MSGNTSSTIEVVDEFFRNFGSGDMSALLDQFADKVDFRVNGAAHVPWAGERSTRAEIEEFFGIFPKVLTAPESFEITGKFAQGEDAVVFATCVFGVKTTGKTFTNAYALHFTVTDGKISRYHMYEDSYAIAEAFIA
ncbi:nuclear transport factor 2 family protein [Nocardia cyriacigeorgica]|uniref:nuclear transport factor 2 family protein n=1 Tax=Nocardia cyriacigeorgica TaxID=135487 RepID=UPI0018931219|nr:nuclear transport factor 2 family protein [Nocardia cyriacigeorgica]MBF6453277.1 nuclear transport factor 2 family protein [Nocardia cyriacigeorgica]MBF6478116.1 nuclear transport factor 2 family protein [Nocardia cyriacigeorgica]MBF6550446.1 nuclear transport factor 2 family protein [Nocardia cyriacigeorgica]